MAVQAIWKNCRVSPQRVRLVADVIRGKQVDAALGILSEMHTKASRCFYKLLHSAIANAEHNHGYDATEMLVSEVFADKATSMRRYMPRAKGRGDRIEKQLSHLTIKLAKQN